MRFVGAAVILVALAFPAAAEETQTQDKPASPPPEAVLAFGASHPECEEWTDGCVVCARGADVVNCSTPGIACQPVETICKRPMK